MTKAKAESTVLVRHPYRDVIARVQVDTGPESMVRQSEHEGTKIDNILKKYAATGVLPVQRRKPMFADVSEFVDYKDALDKTRDAMDMIKKLPAEARELFLLDPAGFQEAITNVSEENLGKLGLIPEKEPPPKKMEAEPAKPEPAKEPAAQ